MGWEGGVLGYAGADFCVYDLQRDSGWTPGHGDAVADCAFDEIGGWEDGNVVSAVGTHFRDRG